MRRVIQLARNIQLATAAQSRSANLSISWQQHQAPCRALSISSALWTKRNDSSSTSGRDNRDSDRSTKKKRGLFEMASDKLSEMSGTRSQSGKQPSKSGGTASDRQTRSSTSSSGGKRSGDAGSSSSNPRDHRAMGSVRHDQGSHRFTLDLGNNQVARIDYRQVGKNMIEMYHTEVPRELRGRGIGKALAKGAFECASRDNLKLKVTCEYLQDYLQRFADAKHRKLTTK